MGRKYFWRQYSYTRLEESGDPGCIAGLLRLLGYHHHNVRKMLPHKKHGAKRRTKNNRVDSGLDEGSRKAISRLTGFGEEEDLAHESNPISVESVDPPETGLESKRSTRGRIRELMAEEENTKCTVSWLQEQSQLKRTHLKETSSHGHAADPSSEDKQPGNVDVFEIFKVNKQIFLKILSDHDLTLLNQAIKPEGLNSKARLTKSGSFPAVRYRGPSKLDDKKREIWPPLKGKESANHSEDQKAKSMAMLNEDGGGGGNGSTSKGKLRSMRRASSLTESMDRYAQLFNSAFNKEIKRHLSRSLKLGNEQDEPIPKFRRRLSLPESEYSSFLPNMEAPREAVEFGSDSIKNPADMDVNATGMSFDCAGEPCEDVMNKAVNADTSHLEQRDDAQEKQGLAVEESPCEEEQMDNIKFPISEDYESGPPSESTSPLEQVENPEIPNTDQVLPTEVVDQKHNSEFNYVKLVLELSSFSMNEQTSVWYSLQQPLNPALFEEIETDYYPVEQPKCATKMVEDRGARKHIFDLINEALVDIDENSCLYYPRALSFSCHVHPTPKGHRLLEEVWWFVRRCLDWRPDLNPTLDFAVAIDLHRKHGWMNLQIESECVALELEDMVLDELLDEILLARC